MKTRRHLPALLLTLPLLLGGGGPGGRTASAQVLPSTLQPTDIPGASEIGGGAWSVAMPAEPAPITWGERIEARLHALRELSRAAGPAAPTPAMPELTATLRSLAAAADSRADIGVAVHDFSTGAPVFRWNAERTLNPASNQKLVTAIAAVELLGPDYRFATRVLQHGSTLYIVGEGDPSLQLEDVAGLAARTAAAIDPASVERIVVDDGFFSGRREAPGYDAGGPGFSYLAPSDALSLQFNTVEVTVHPTRSGEPPVVALSPDCPHLRVENGATTGRGGGLQVQTREDGEQTVVAVDGRISRRARSVRIRRRVGDPALFFGQTFADRLADLTGTDTRPVERGAAPRDADMLAEHESAPLPEVLGSALLYSNNFTTEQVLRTLGARASGEPGDWENGRRVIERFWAAIGRDADELHFVNASGYSQEGRISAEAIVALLALLEREGSPSATLLPALPAPGEHGTLRRRLGRARGHLRAKTGTLQGASALSGIVQTDAGDRYGFSILVNGRVSTDSSRRLQDRIVTALLRQG